MNVRLKILLSACLTLLCTLLVTQFTGYDSVAASPLSQEPPPLIPFSFDDTIPGVPQSAVDGPLSVSTNARQPVTVLIELEGEPTARFYATARARSTEAEAVAQAQARLLQIEAAQRTLLAAPFLAEAEVIYQLQRTYNGIALRVDPLHIDRITELTGVRAVHPLPTYEVELVRSVPFLGAPDFWDTLRSAGVDGSSVSIGIVDTGIDYLHRTFGGPGTGYLNNDPTRIDDLSAFPSAKVVGGFDFVGDGYNAGRFENAMPLSDPDPMDCWGHGTHVAGIAAGYGTLLNGDNYVGDYDSSLNFSQFAIGPGVAPQAKLYALKVFGCSGSTQVVEQAIEWAVDPNQDGDFSDRLDVLNLSLGSAFGSSTSPTAIAIDNAVQAGMIVVAAAGNTGDTYYNVAGPGVAARAISVAASSTQPLAASQSSVVPVEAVAGFTARGPRRGDSLLKPDISAPGVGIASAAAGSGSGRRISSGTSMATPHVAGAAALLRQLYPQWSVEEIKARLINLARYDLPETREYPPVYYSAARTGAGRVDLSSIADAEMLLYNADNSGAVSLSYGSPSIVGQMTLLQNARLINKSERSQRVFLEYVPAVDLPGVDFEILGAAEREVAAYGSQNIAVVLQADAAEMRHVADPTVSWYNRFPRHRLSEESGFLYAWPQPTALTAALLPVDLVAKDTVTGSTAFTLNPATRQLSVTLSISATSPMTVRAVNLRYGSVYEAGPLLHSLSTEPTIAATDVHIGAEVTLNRAEMAFLSAQRLYISVEIDGLLTQELRGRLDTPTPVLRLPVYAAPQAAASMRSGVAWLELGSEALTVQSVPLVGEGLMQSSSLTEGSYPTDTVSLVSAFELQLRSPNESSSTGLLDHADLKYVGIAVNPTSPGAVLQSQPVEDRRIVFGIVTHGEWSTPNEVKFGIFIDTNEDGHAEYVLSTTDFGTYQGIGASDEYVTWLESSTGDRRISYFVNLISAAELHTALFNSNVLLMAVDADMLALSEDNSDFRYTVAAYSRDLEERGMPVDFVSGLFYDVANPGVVSNDGSAVPLFYDLPGRNLTFSLDRSGLQRNRSQGLLLIHHHNTNGQRAEVIEIRAQWEIYLPFFAPSVYLLD